jgi:hypothetical protein
VGPTPSTPSCLHTAPRSPRPAAAGHGGGRHRLVPPLAPRAASASKLHRGASGTALPRRRRRPDAGRGASVAVRAPPPHPPIFRCTCESPSRWPPDARRGPGLERRRGRRKLQRHFTNRDGGGGDLGNLARLCGARAAHQSVCLPFRSAGCTQVDRRSEPKKVLAGITLVSVGVSL